MQQEFIVFSAKLELYCHSNHKNLYLHLMRCLYRITQNFKVKKWRLSALRLDTKLTLQFLKWLYKLSNNYYKYIYASLLIYVLTICIIYICRCKAMSRQKQKQSNKRSSKHMFYFPYISEWDICSKAKDLCGKEHLKVFPNFSCCSWCRHASKPLDSIEDDKRKHLNLALEIKGLSFVRLRNYVK